MRRVQSALLLVGFAGGCDPALVTDEGRLGVDVDLHWPPGLAPYEDVPIVAGSRWCPAIVGHFARPSDPESYHEHDLSECFDISVEGPVTWGDGCARLESAGELRVTMTPTPCADREDEEIPDAVETLSVEVVDPAAVRGQLHANDDLWFEYLRPGQGQSFPDDWWTTPDEPVRVAEGGKVYLRAGLVVDDVRAAAWSDGAIMGADVDGVVVTDDRVRLEVEGVPGLRLDATLVLPHSIHSLGVIETVAVDAAASIEVVPGYGFEIGIASIDGTTTRTEWIAMRAVVRDLAGRPIWGMPIEWSVVDGRLAMQSGEQIDWAAPVDDYALVADVCADKPRTVERRTAIVQARVGEISDTALLEWTAMPEMPGAEPPSEEWLAQCVGPEGPDGCGCSTGAPRSVPWLVVLFAILRPRRSIRRRSTRTPLYSPMCHFRRAAG